MRVVYATPTYHPHVGGVEYVIKAVKWSAWTPGGAYHVPRHRARLEKTLKELLMGADVLHVHSIHAALPVWAGLKTREPGFKGAGGLRPLPWHKPHPRQEGPVETLHRKVQKL